MDRPCATSILKVITAAYSREKRPSSIAANFAKLPELLQKS